MQHTSNTRTASRHAVLERWEKSGYSAAGALDLALSSEAAAVGLSPLHIPPRSTKTGSTAAKLTATYAETCGPRRGSSVRMPQATVAKGGRLFTLKGGRVQADQRKRGGTRGAVAGFSAGSRRRLMRVLASINQAAVPHMPLFLTLTYPATWDADPKRWKRDLEVFGKRLRRYFPTLAYIWRLEFQERGAPHFHLLCFGVRHIPYLLVARWWYEVVGSNDAAHLKAGTEVRRVRSWRGVMSYAAKYMSKVAAASVELPEHVGRWWGVVGLLPIEYASRSMSFHQFYTLRRWLRRYIERATGRRTYAARGVFDGLTVYLSSAAGERLIGTIGGF